MQQLTTNANISDLAYCAGLIDGEGCISAAPIPRCPASYSVTLTVGMCDREGLDLLVAVFGGEVRADRKLTSTGKTLYRWSLSCRKAAAALRLLEPYLRVKRARAVWAIALAETAKQGADRVVPLTEAETAYRRSLATLIRSANRKARATEARL